MTAANYEITVEAGTTWQLVLTLYDSSNALIDLTNYSARMMVRDSPTGNVTYMSLTTVALGGITLGGVAGTITIDRSATQTSALKFTAGVYDLEIQSSTGEVTRVLQGDFIVSPEVTR